MNQFKKIMAQSHTQNKDCLHKLYTDRQIYISCISSSMQPIEDEKIYHYREISFTFAGTGFRAPQRMTLDVWVPGDLAGPGGEIEKQPVPWEDWLLRNLSGPINALARSLQNDHKDTREKPDFFMQETDQAVRRRSGCLYRRDRRAFRLRISFVFPLIGGHSVNGKSGYKGIKMLLDTLCDCLENADRESLREQIGTWERQADIRNYLKKNGLMAFVADGSILPRQGDTQLPLGGAVPFLSPSRLRVKIPCRDGKVLTGMGIPRGITLITGGGYGGKSTLLDALEQGIYFHVKGDGREYVITEETACKIYAEDGRNVQTTDLSPFFSHMPGAGGAHAFSTVHASGSVSQAANIVEAVYGGSRCLLMDEDTSATNFMIRDRLMRRLVRKEPIIPYTDRVEELKERGVSTILVIGGSGEYLEHGDCVLLMEDYRVYDRTSKIRELLVCPEGRAACSGGAHGQKEADPELTDRESGVIPQREVAGGDGHIWMERKTLPRELCCGEAPCSRTVGIDHGRYIRLGEITADITRLTAVGAAGQVHTLAWLLEKLLSQDPYKEADLRVCCEQLVQSLFEDSADVILSSRGHAYEFWLEEVRGLDLLMAAARLRKSC